MAESWSSAPVLLQTSADSGWWDNKSFSGAVVTRSYSTGGYKMYYYGRAKDEWNLGVKPFNITLPTGRIGLATSDDGLKFERFKGQLDGGAIMDPSNETSAFDCVHIGVGDVVNYDNKWWMFYFGGGMDVVHLFGNALTGAKLESGLAFSEDGVNFERTGQPVLRVGKPGEWDENGASWPRVVPPAIPGQKWQMTYHTRESGGSNNIGFFSAGVATSVDGITWEKQGKILSHGAPGSWDEGGVSVRHVLRVRPDEFVMVYEGSNLGGEFAIGLATSADGIVWRKDEQCGPESGGPILKARKGENVWDNFAVATPYAMLMEDGSLRLYYLGLGKLDDQEEITRGFGIAISSGDYRSWTRL